LHPSTIPTFKKPAVDFSSPYEAGGRDTGHNCGVVFRKPIQTKAALSTSTRGSSDNSLLLVNQNILGSQSQKVGGRVWHRRKKNQLVIRNGRKQNKSGCSHLGWRRIWDMEAC
jgi:hypothetical protein